MFPFLNGYFLHSPSAMSREPFRLVWAGLFWLSESSLPAISALGSFLPVQEVRVWGCKKKASQGIYTMLLWIACGMLFLCALPRVEKVR